MTTTQAFLLKCLNDHIHRCKTSVPEGVDRDELIVLAKLHEVAGIIYQQIDDSAFKAPLASFYASSIYQYAERNRSFDEIIKRFEDKNISYALVKGPIIASLYPYPVLRTMGDIDILVHKEDIPEIVNIMADLKYECLSTNHSLERDWDYIRNNIEFEIHPKLIYPDDQVEKRNYIDFFNDFWPYAEKNHSLDKSFHLLFLFVHLRRHFLNRGAGFRHFMDIGIFVNAYRDELNWDWINEKLAEFKLEKFACMCCTCIEKWFGIKSPLPDANADDETLEESAQLIFQYGVFGLTEKDPANALASYDMARNGGFFGLLRYRLRKLFPPYSIMSTSPPYEFIEGKPYLLPVAWIFRFFYILFCRKDKIKGSNLQTENMNARINMIRQWGM